MVHVATEPEIRQIGEPAICPMLLVVRRTQVGRHVAARLLAAAVAQVQRLPQPRRHRPRPPAHVQDVAFPVHQHRRHVAVLRDPARRLAGHQRPPVQPRHRRPGLQPQRLDNTRVFENAGLVNKDGSVKMPRTWDDVTRAADAIGKKSGGTVYGLGFGNGAPSGILSYWIEVFVRAAGRPGGAISFSVPGGVGMDVRTGKYSFGSDRNYTDL